jgi:trans-aconitate 2-methyltransferase
MNWDPDQYLRHGGHRRRPGVELLNRLHVHDPSMVIDLGCGPGNLTALLSQRWPDAEVVGVDSSSAMIGRARADHPELTWIEADIASWEPDGPVDVVYSNAALHWLDNHDRLFPRLLSWLVEGGAMAVQMPDNWDAPTHRVPADVLDGGDWPEAARSALPRDRVAPPGLYLEWLSSALLDMWRTTYFHRLTGSDPVWQWVTGSVLRPVLAVLDDDQRTRFEAECRNRYRRAYPPLPPSTPDNSITILPFSRLFMIATA